MFSDITNTTKNIQSKSKEYISNPSVNADELEHYLFNIFEKELNTPDSVLLSS